MYNKKQIYLKFSGKMERRSFIKKLKYIRKMYFHGVFKRD